MRAAAHLIRLRRQLEAVEDAEQRETAAAKVLTEAKAAREDGEGKLHALIRRPHEVLEEHELDSDTGEPTDAASYLGKIKAAEHDLDGFEEREKLAKNGRSKLKHEVEHLLGDLRKLVKDPDAELLPYEEAEVDEDEDEHEEDGS